MTNEKDRAALLVNFATALGELTAEAMTDMSAERRALLDRALATGTGHVRLTVIPKPLTVIGTLHAGDCSIPPRILFRIEGDAAAESIPES